MSKKEKNDYLEEVLVRLIAMDWVLDGLTNKSVCSLKTFGDFFKLEIKKCLVSFDKYYLKISTPKKKVLKKRKKTSKGYELKPFPMPLGTKNSNKGIKNARTHTKRKNKKSSKNKKSKK